MHGDRKLRCNFCNHVGQGNATKVARHFTQPKYCKIAGMRVLADIWNNTGYTFVEKTARQVQRWMADEGIRDTRSTTGGQRPRADEAETDEMQDFLDAQEGGEGRVGEAGMRDEAAGRCEPDLPGEEVVMTSRTDGTAGRGARASRPELERARREKRKVGEEDVDVRDTAREKRARQTTIDELYAKEKLSEFTDTWLKWIYEKGLSFNAFRGSEFQRMERTPSGAGVRHRSPSELRTDDFYVGGSSGGLGDLSAPRQRGASLSDVLLDDSDVRGHVEIAEERDARLDREEEEGLRTLPGWEGRFTYMEEQRRRRELETGGGGNGDRGDVGFGGEADAGAARQGVPPGVEGDGVPTGVERDGGGEDEDEDEEGSDHGDDHGDDGDDHGDGGDDDDDGDHDGNHGDGGGGDGGDGGGDDDEGRLALVLRDPSMPSLPLTRPEAFAQAGFVANDLARLGSHDCFPHTGRRSSERRPPGGAYSPPPYIVDSPRCLSPGLGQDEGGLRCREGRFRRTFVTSVLGCGQQRGWLRTSESSHGRPDARFVSISDEESFDPTADYGPRDSCGHAAESALHIR
ncbi:hypothetical protein CBR_g78859 [Chara braunii]|uniref:BED-type domain-containing protein n=1 Tax=Chara braunii TaxID=69332 RepID=A0A388KAJ8_CHABU|nr:hypothetical protein CBR_g78859 [Chara braunii]|eukprot:GBG67078.1 hypothetical protein CBR_g78859 [Chara braunii]